MSTAKVVQERVFLPYELYIDSARHFVAEFDRKEYVSWYDLAAAVTLLALSVEAIANTIGEHVIEDFKDFESSSPKAKIRLICEKLGIQFDRTTSPFTGVLELLRVRNQLAHPKFQRLKYESKEMPLTAAQKHYQEVGEPLHDIEKALTPEMARTSLAAVTALASTLLAAIEPRLRGGSSKRLIIDGQDFLNAGSGGNEA
jgi:hypothetical protein